MYIKGCEEKCRDSPGPKYLPKPRKKNETRQYFLGEKLPTVGKVFTRLEFEGQKEGPAPVAYTPSHKITETGRFTSIGFGYGDRTRFVDYCKSESEGRFSVNTRARGVCYSI